MDPVTAIGLAAAVIQFISFSKEVFQLCKEIRDSNTHATKHNQELEAALRTIKDARDLMISPDAARASIVSADATHEPTALSNDTRELIARADTPMKKKINSLAQQCSKDAQALIIIIEEIRGPLRSKQWPVLQKMLKALKQKRKVEKLENALKSKETQLNALLTQDTHANVESIKAHTTALQPSIARIDKRLGKVDKHLRTKRAEATASQQEKNFLASLSFPDMNARLDSIKEAHTGTAEWIFEQHEERKWHDFPRWLAQPTDSMYWICGKAASGKSTLMARLLNDARTKQILKQWSNRRKLHLLSFFFWKPGSDLQRSIVGVLRSLLYQVCQKSQHLLRHVMNVDGSASYHSWTQTRLVDTLKSVLAQQSKICFAIFIDGLDEYDGDCYELVDLFKTLQSNPTLKFCVSSRPEAQLTLALRSCKSLRMQDYNLPDIDRYVTDKLGEYDTADGLVTSEGVEEIRGHIVSNASGMFLWAVLVVKTILKGLRLGDDAMTIRQRLTRLPKEIDDLLRQMLKDVDEVYKPNLLFYFRALIAFQKTELGLYATELSIVEWPECVQTYETLEQACRKTAKQVEKQSAGLLEWHVDWYTPEQKDLDSDREPEYHEDWDGSDHDYVNAERWAVIAVPAMLHQYHPEHIHAERRRKTILQASTLKEIISFSSLRLAWIHRSLYDVVRYDLENLFGQALTSKLNPDYVRWSCLKGAVTAVSVVPVVAVKLEPLPPPRPSQLKDILLCAQDEIAETRKDEIAQLVWDMSPCMTSQEIMAGRNGWVDLLLPQQIPRQALLSTVFSRLGLDSVFVREQLSSETMKEDMAGGGWLYLVLHYQIKFFNEGINTDIFARMMELALDTWPSFDYSSQCSVLVASEIFINKHFVSCWDEDGGAYQTAKLDRQDPAISRLQAFQDRSEYFVHVLYYLQRLTELRLDLQAVYAQPFTRRLFELATACKLRFSLPDYMRNSRRMLIYAPLNLATIWYQVDAWDWPMDLDPGTGATKPCLWLFCHPRRPYREPEARHAEVVVLISAEATTVLMELLSAEKSSPLEFDSLLNRTQDILMLQIAKQDPPLSSTQQLLARACLRYTWIGYFETWWHSRNLSSKTSY